MRARRRPILQDKTPVNTLQKPKFKTTRSAKAKLVPVVEIKAVRRTSRGKGDGAKKEHPPKDVAEAGDGTPITIERRQHDKKPKRQNATVRQGRNRGGVPRERRVQLDSAPDVDLDVPVADDDNTASLAVAEENTTPYDRSVRPQDVRGLPSPVSPTAPHHITRKPLESLPPSNAVAHRPSTPDSVPVADDESTASDAVKEIMNTPSPARIIRTPIPAQSTPLGRLPPLAHSFEQFPVRGRHDSSIKKWNASVARAYSPLPPSSPPPPSPPTQLPVAMSSQPRHQMYEFSDEPDEDQENVVSRPIYAKRERLSDDDPFGLLAVERKLKTLRQRRVGGESSRVPGASRAPLGTLALDEVPSSIPDRLPTPIPSDDHNIDDLYLDVDPIRPAPSGMRDYEDIEDEDKENIPAEDYDLNENKENLPPPHRVVDDYKRNDPLSDDAADDDELDYQENLAVPSVPPLLLASARKKPDMLLAPSSSSADSPGHALRTPHKHRNAHRRSPLPTPRFSDGGFDDSPLTARSMGVRDSSPSPVKPSAARIAARKPARQPLATLALEVEDPEPQKIVGKKRTRAQVEETSEDSDPRVAVRKLEALLPKRKKRTRTTVAPAAQGKKRAAAARKGTRQESVESESASDEDEDDDSSPPKAPARATRGRGRATTRGRARGRAASVTAGRAPTTRGRSTSRGRPVSKGKGKEKVVEADPDEDEERAQKRQERIAYFRKLKEYSLEKEDIYVI